MEEAAVAPARPVPAAVCLDEDDAAVRVAPAERERGPEPDVAAAHDDDVRVDAPRQRRGRLRCAGFRDPPGG
jgi:hypothetical protein